MSNLEKLAARKMVLNRCLRILRLCLLLPSDIVEEYKSDVQGIALPLQGDDRTTVDQLLQICAILDEDIEMASIHLEERFILNRIR